MVFSQTALVILGSFIVSLLFGMLFFYITRKRRVNFTREHQISAEGQFLQKSEVASENIIQYSKVIKILALLCIIIWIIALLITWNSPATTYEANIYSATPSIFWIANIVNLIIGIGIIIHQITHQSYKHKSDLRIIGFVLVFLVFASIISLWIIRGYAFVGEGVDSFTHLGWIRNIINSGHLENANYYPITHIYLAQLSEISNISPSIVTKCMPVIFASFSVLFM